MRSITLAVPCLLALALLAACNGGGQSSPAGVTASCQKIGSLDSYRYSILVRLQAPAFQGDAGPDVQTTPDAPLGEFAETLSALLSDFEIRGAHVAPDRTQAILRFKEDEVELRAIGARRWERFGSVWEEQDTPSPDIGFLTPSVVCEDIVQEIAAGLDPSIGQDDAVNGVEASHYALDEADLSRLPALLGAGPETELPDQFRVDVWLARDGGWPVKLDINAEDTDEQGNPLSMELYMELRDINDSGIRIEEPAVSSPQ